ncbi:hypothetical protein AWU65_03145 [Paenibacillus glucanolyticus]|uniref:Uncharacterized protein n=1 Tax=Paenibacillus glucanolyticus TaxID=59843 RepID=A0A163GIH9_9BACL|nr:hypothetical protein AWU65_03145 [Paenibacillus glucanolyticus]OMF63637.1 hypothetical protein BK142_32595 [Paenibacillus glucanolyticus]
MNNVNDTKGHLIKRKLFIIISLIFAISMGMGSALLHYRFPTLSSLIIAPFVGIGITVYFVFLSKFNQKVTDHYALILIMIIFSFISTLIIY